MRVGVRELKRKFGQYLRLVKSGQTLVITERGKPIGQFMPFGSSLDERLQAMVAAGLAEWNGQKLKPHKPMANNRRKQQISDLVIQNR